MVHFNLIAKIKDKSLLVDLIHEYGTTFYQKLGKNKYRVIYFSGSRLVVFEGALDENTAKKIEEMGFEVSEIEIDEEEKIIRIEQ